MNKKLIGVFIALLLIIVGIGVFYASKKDSSTAPITSFEECAEAGYPIMESYPEQCMTPDGKSFTRDIDNELEFSDEILVSNPRPGQIINSPLTIEGEARGSWYFEANFPLELIDDNGTSLGISFATAQGEWMTEEFVPFTAQLLFDQPTTPNGTLIIRNANPSGLPENQKEVTIPVLFE